MSNPFAPDRTHPAALARDAAPLDAASMSSDIDTIGFFDWNVASGEIAWSRGVEEQLGGVERQKLLRVDGITEFLDDEDRARMTRGLALAERHGLDRLVFRARFNAPGGPMLLEAIALSWFDKEFKLERISGVVLDVSEHDRYRRTLARSEALLRTMIATGPDASVMIDATGIITGFNLAAERMFGYTADQAVGRNVAMLMPEPMSGQHDEYIASYLAGRPAKVIGKARQLTARRADGAEFPIELNVGEVEADDERFFIAFIRDLTERMEAAQRLDELRDRFFRMARLNLMGTVAAGLAHELNQPLAASSNFLATAEYLLAARPDPGEAPELLRNAREQIQLAGDIIKRLRGFLSPGGTSGEPVEVASLVAEARGLVLFGRQRREIHFDSDYADDAGVVHVDRIQFLQVLTNLIRNSAGAMDQADGVTHRIAITSRRNGDWVKISVTDNGPGFPTGLLERHEHIFRSSRNEGMGLGLTICRRIIEGWGGKMKLSNAPKGGARIEFTVPAELGEDPAAVA